MRRWARPFALTALASVLAFGSLGPGPARAVNPDEILADPALEARARAISSTIRCVLCRNQSIDESNAAIAATMRVIIRERLTAGESDEEVVAFLVHRFGNFILLNPPLQPSTYLLWSAPVIILLAAILGFSGLWSRNRRSELPGDIKDLSEEDRALVERLLREGPKA